MFLASNCEKRWGRWRTLILGCANSSLRSCTRRLTLSSRRLDRLSTTARFETESGNENVAGGSSCLRTHSTRSLCARPTAQLQQLSRPSLQCYMRQPRKPNKGALTLACSRDQAPAPRARTCICSRLHRDSDLAGSVDHTHCCTLHTTAQSSHLYGRRAFEPVEERPVGERQWAWTVGKTRKTPLLSIKTQQRADTTRSRRDNKCSSHAGGNTKPGWTSSFSPSSWRGQRHACPRPHLFQWRTREKVLGGTKSGCVLSAVQR